MNKTNFSKYLEQRDPELHEQMLNELGFKDIYNYGKSAFGVAKKVASGVAGVTDKLISKGNELNKQYFPSQIRKDGKWVNKPAEPQAAPATQPQAAPATQPQATSATQPQAAPATQPQATSATQPQATPAVDNNFLKSFKILYRAVNGNEIDDSEIDNLGMNQIIKYYDKLKKIPTFNKFNKLYKQYSGTDYADPKKWYGNPLKKRMEYYEIIKDKVARGLRAKSYKVVKNDNSDDDFTPDFSDFNPSAGEFGRGKNNAYEHYNLTFKNWFDQRLTVEGDREDAFAINNDRICQAVQRIKSQIEDMKKQGAKPEDIKAMIIRHDDIATRCKKVPV